LLDALTDRGVANVITVSEQEATESLALGIADRGGYTDVAVCIVDPDDALFTMVSPDGVTTERVDPSADDMLALLDRHDAQPEAIFVLGSADDLDSIAASFHGAAVPVITAAEADGALARGAALASAWAVNTLDMRPARWRLPSRTGALISVVAAAAVVFVGSLSAAIGLGLTQNENSTVAQRDTAATAEQPARVPAAPPAAQAAPQPVPAAPSSPAAPSPSSAARCRAARGGHGARAGRDPDGRAACGAAARAGECSSTCLRTSRACAELRSARAATAASRPDHRAHPDHRSVPRTQPVRLALRGQSIRYGQAAGASSRTALSAGSIYVTTASASPGPRFATTCGIPAWMKTASPALYATGTQPGACWTYKVPRLTTEYSGPACVCHPLLEAGFNSRFWM
jgi:hypothetical protein